MPDVVTIDNLHIRGGLTVDGLAEPSDASVDNSHFFPASSIQRIKLAQDALQRYAIPLSSFRVWDALRNTLPATSTADDLGWGGGVAGTSSGYLSIGDVKAAGQLNRYARTIVYVPPTYDPFESINLVSHAGMNTTVADVNCDIDFKVYRVAKSGLTVSADLNSAAAKSINSTTWAEDSFALAATAMQPGDMLDIRLGIDVRDNATGTAVEAGIGAIYLECDIKG